MKGSLFIFVAIVILANIPFIGYFPQISTNTGQLNPLFWLPAPIINLLVGLEPFKIHFYYDPINLYIFAPIRCYAQDIILFIIFLVIFIPYWLLLSIILRKILLKTVNKTKLLILILIVVSFSVWGFVLYRNHQRDYLSKEKKAETLPLSYKECDQRAYRKGNFNPDDYIFPFCGYSTNEGSPSYQECITHGGTRSEGEIISHYGIVSARCTIRYIDPKFVLPKNYNECRKISSSSGGRDANENEGKPYCIIQLSKKGVYNLDVGERVFEECLSQNGKLITADVCELKFYEE